VASENAPPIENSDEIEVIEEVEVEVIPSVQERSRYELTNVYNGERIINLLTAHPTRQYRLIFVVDHRAYQTFISSGDAFYEFLGLDAGTLKIGLGLRYGIFDFLDVGIYRLSNGIDAFDTYEFDVRGRFLRQDRHYLNMAARGGVTWFSQRENKDAVGYFFQTMLDRVVLRQLMLGVGFAFHSESSSDAKSADDTAYSGAVQGMAEWRAPKLVALATEVSWPVLGYRGDYPIFAFALKFLTHRHSFALVVSNSQYMCADGMVAGSWRSFSDLVFGIQVIREFNLTPDKAM
jgi:hypothetical protein